MKKKLTILLLALASAVPATAQNWSVGARSGAFAFGDFVERRLRPVTSESPAEPATYTLSAATRPGVAIDLERQLGERWAVRLEGTFAKSPLTVEDSTDEGADIRSGDVDITTFTVPLVFRINRNGAFRFHLLAGPAYAIYRFEPPDRGTSIAVGDVTRNEWGVIGGAGVTWHLSERFGIEGSIADIVTTSPFDEGDTDDLPGFEIPRPHNVHTTVGIRYRF
jgi:outer membrane protein W